MIQELPVTKKDVVWVLQRYKPAWAKILRRPIVLDFENGEIKVYESGGGVLFDKDIALNKIDYRALGLEELLPHLYVIKLVEEWFEELSEREREVLFWRYINHDYEMPDIADEVNDGMRYKTLPYRFIAKKLGMSVSAVWKCAQNALEKITKTWII